MKKSKDSLLYQRFFSYFVGLISKMLFNRVIELAKIKEGSVKGLAEKLGMLRQTFNGYLSESREDNLWPLLPRLLDLYPDISREWLYLGEGEIFGGKNAKEYMHEKILSEALAQVKELQAELTEERRLNRKLMARLLVDGVGDKDAALGIGNTADGQG